MIDIMFRSANLGLGFESRSEFQWALAIPSEKKRKHALIRLFKVDRVVELWIRYGQDTLPRH